MKKIGSLFVCLMLVMSTMISFAGSENPRGQVDEVDGSVNPSEVVRTLGDDYCPW